MCTFTFHCRCVCVQVCVLKLRNCPPTSCSLSGRFCPEHEREMEETSAFCCSLNALINVQVLFFTPHLAWVTLWPHLQSDSLKLEPISREARGNRENLCRAEKMFCLFWPRAVSSGHVCTPFPGVCNLLVFYAKPSVAHRTGQPDSPLLDLIRLRFATRSFSPL